MEASPDTTSRPSNSAPVLDLDTIAPVRPTIRIKTKDYPQGKLYELAVLDDLSLTDQQYLYSHGQEMERLVGLQDPTEEEDQQLHVIVDRLVQICVPSLEEELLQRPTQEELDLPKVEQPSRLKGMQKVKIVEAFITASPEIAERVEAERAKRSTGATGSAGSSAGTGATPAPGSTSPRGN